jgi:hypothetical protein
MVLRQSLRQLLRSFSLDNLRARLLGQDGRKMQQELDTHKLFLYTTLHEKLKSGMASVDPQQILAESASVGYAAQVASVRQLLRQQVRPRRSTACSEPSSHVPASTGSDCACEEHTHIEPVSHSAPAHNSPHTSALFVA